MKINTEHYKKVLEKELALLENELKSVGHINPDNKGDWEATPPDTDNHPAEEEEIAEKIEVYEDNTAVLKELEVQFNDVKKALERIEEGTYGTCTVCGKTIETERLEAEPSAHTCKEHLSS